ncbi:MAG: repressor LexA [Pseudobdellovibrionaceae bacterium]|nr:transcriptional repressor LexA [Bdellovibrionales bacterium]USN46569.1 MAG: repressor LexA [Pseudobdellovibrionaceae bacterium]
MSLTPMSLTPKEKHVLEYIQDYLCQRGFAPTYREIKDHFGFASFNSVQRYLKQLQRKQYISVAGDNQKRAISLLQPATALQNSMEQIQPQHNADPHVETETPSGPPGQRESHTLPLLGRVAAGLPIEALEDDEFIDVPVSLLRNPSKSYALKVEGQSMIDDGIFDGDIILVQEQRVAQNGEIVVAIVDNEATVKRFYFHSPNQRQFKLGQKVLGDDSGLEDLSQPQVELRPANTSMDSFWYAPEKVEISGVVVGLIRKF